MKKTKTKLTKVKIKGQSFYCVTRPKLGKGRVTPLGYRKLLARARRAAGIQTWPNNALRHGFASYYLAHFKKAGAAELALELGHTNTNLVFQHYRELVKPKDGKRYWSIVPETKRANIVPLAKAA